MERFFGKMSKIILGIIIVLLFMCVGTNVFAKAKDNTSNVSIRLKSLKLMGINSYYINEEKSEIYIKKRTTKTIFNVEVYKDNKLCNDIKSIKVLNKNLTKVLAVAKNNSIYFTALKSSTKGNNIQITVKLNDNTKVTRTYKVFVVDHILTKEDNKYCIGSTIYHSNVEKLNGIKKDSDAKLYTYIIGNNKSGSKIVKVNSNNGEIKACKAGLTSINAKPINKNSGLKAFTEYVFVY